jgi:hypothetical protein
MLRASWGDTWGASAAPYAINTPVSSPNEILARRLVQFEVGTGLRFLPRGDSLIYLVRKISDHFPAASADHQPTAPGFQLFEGGR